MILPLRFLATLALLLTAFASPALAAEPYEGRWADDPAWCKNTRQSNTDELPIVISRKSIETFASFCRVLSTTRKGAAWWLHTSCRDEGQTETEPRAQITFVLRVDGNRLYLRDDTGVQNLHRCPR